MAARPWRLRPPHHHSLLENGWPRSPTLAPGCITCCQLPPSLPTATARRRHLVQSSKGSKGSRDSYSMPEHPWASHGGDTAGRRSLSATATASSVEDGTAGGGSGLMRGLAEEGRYTSFPPPPPPTEASLSTLPRVASGWGRGELAITAGAAGAGAGATHPASLAPLAHENSMPLSASPPPVDPLLSRLPPDNWQRCVVDGKAISFCLKEDGSYEELGTGAFATVSRRYMCTVCHVCIRQAWRTRLGVPHPVSCQ